jgi:hypothetical protein
MGKIDLGGVVRRAWFTLRRLVRARGHGISILVPLYFDGAGGQRERNWNWLREYWRVNLPGAEVVIGRDAEAIRSQTPFSKSAAINDAASRALGDVFVVVDADIYIPAQTIVDCAKEIRLAVSKGRKLWFVPYRKIFRLTEEASRKLLESSPKRPVTPTDGIQAMTVGHWWGAMIQMMPREAFETVGGWDPRFKGWGGEDRAAMVAMDTLYGPHKTFRGEVLHIWHPVITRPSADNDRVKSRMWANQDPSQYNNVLSGRYFASQWNVKRMRRLVDEFKNEGTVSSPDSSPPTSTISP